MKVKRIYAEDMRQAIRKVEEQARRGHSSTTTAGGVEVLAALDANAGAGANTLRER